MTVGRVIAWGRRRASHRLVALAAVLCISGAVVAHHFPPEMPGMGAGMICLAVLAVAVAVTAAKVLRRPNWPTTPIVPPPLTIDRGRALAVPARAGPLFLLLLVLRH
jgi:hypothetical protein